MDKGDIKASRKKFFRIAHNLIISGDEFSAFHLNKTWLSKIIQKSIQQDSSRKKVCKFTQEKGVGLLCVT
jgi:hypothetical protein